MDSRLFNSKSIFGIFITFILLEMFSDIKSLLNQMIKIFRDFSSESFFSEDSLDFLSCQKSDLRNCIIVSEDDTDLALSVTLLGEFKDEFFDILDTKIVDW